MEVTRITFQADEQQLVKTSGIDTYASNIVNYVEADFTLGTNWTGFDSVSAMWKSGADVIATVLDGEGKCLVPHELLEKRGELKVNLVGSVVENGELTERLTSFPIIALIVTKIAQVEGDETSPVTPSQFEQYVAATNSAADRAYEAQTAAETAQGLAESAQAGAEAARDIAVAKAGEIENLSAQAETLSPGSPATADYNENTGVLMIGVPKGEQGQQGVPGQDGADGFSPIVTTTPIEGGTEVTITDKNGEHSFPVLNGDVSNFYSFLPTDTADGAIASFPDGADEVPMLSLVADIDPIQAGTPTLYGTDQVPNLLKAIPYAGNTVTESKIVGGTVAKNQLVQNGNFENVGTWSTYMTSYTVNNNEAEMVYNGYNASLFQDFAIPAGHKTFVSVDVKVGTAESFDILYDGVNIKNVTSTAYERVTKIISGDGSERFQISLRANNTSETGYVKNAMVVDLTQMFNPQIADYLYTLESGTAGAGVAKLREWGFLNGIDPYNAGSLQSVENLASKVIRDANDTVLATYALDSSLTLRGIPKLDGSNNLYYDGDTYHSNGQVDRIMGEVDLGGLEWTYISGDHSRMYAAVSNIKLPAEQAIGNIICGKYTTDTLGNVYIHNADKTIAVHNTAQQIWIYDTAYTAAAAFKAAMDGVYLTYELATPTTETATPFTETQVNGSTEEYVGSPIPVGHSTTYHDVFPISGRTEVTVSRAGKNLLNLVESEMVTKGWNRIFPISVKAGTYIISCQNQFGASSKGASITLTDEGDQNIILALTSGYSFGDSVFEGVVSTISEEQASKIKNIRFALRASGATYADIVEGDLQLELGSTATAYTPYNPNSLTITTQLGQTVYGGTLDVVSGELVIDKAMKTFVGADDEGWSKTAYNYFMSGAISGAINANASADNFQSNLYPYGAIINNSVTLGGCLIWAGVRVRLADMSLSLDEWKSSLTNTPLQVVYPLATPITVQLTPTEVDSLLGTNNVWADSGDTEVTYKADIQRYISKQISAMLNA